MNPIPGTFLPIPTERTPLQYLADMILRHRIQTVGIWGASGSGKTTFARTLGEELGADKAFVWKVENYWQYTRSEMAERGLTGYHWETRDKQRFLRDFQQVKRGNSVESPLFDNIREVPTDQTVSIAPKDIIILEDTLDFSQIADLGVFMYAPDEILIKRRVARDAHQTGLGTVSDLETYVKTKSLPTYKTILLPSMPKADFIIDTHQGVLYKHNSFELQK